MTTIKDITQHLEGWAPPSYQENYDNAGLLTGGPGWEVSGVLVTLDVTENVVEEALRQHCNLIVAHHPIIFKGLKKLTGANYVERTVIKAIKHEVAIFAIHTNLDSIASGVNHKIAEKIGLRNLKILAPTTGNLSKLTVFVPEENAGTLLDALHQAGAGAIGNYSRCSFRQKGTGTFLPGEGSNPHIGKKNVVEEVSEYRVELIFPNYKKRQVLSAMYAAHPYEEVAYYLHDLANVNTEVGAGMTGELEKPLDSMAFLSHLKKSMGLQVVKHTTPLDKPVEKVALCGGAGSFLLKTAIAQKADVFVSADFKYHEYFDAEGQIMIADIGHYESEQFTKDLIFEHLSEIFPNIALHLSKVVTNPIFYV